METGIDLWSFHPKNSVIENDRSYVFPASAGFRLSLQKISRVTDIDAELGRNREYMRPSQIERCYDIGLRLFGTAIEDLKE